MPTFIFTSPDGQEYHVDGPDGATHEQAWEQLQKQLGTSTKKKTPSFTDDVVKGAKGTLAAVGDLASGLVKLPVAAALAVGGKLAYPEQNLQESFVNAQKAVEETYPSFGQGMEDNRGYTTPMLPFEKLGEGLNYVAKKASMGNPNVEGAINIAGQFAPIPFVKPVAKGLGKVIETVDPGLRNVQAPQKPAPLPSNVPPQVPISGAPDGLPMAVEGDLFNRRAYQQELPLASSVETIADMQRAKHNPNQLDLFGDNSGGQRMPYDAEGIKLREEAARAAAEAQAARTAQEQAAALERFKNAQNALEQRQKLIEQEVARQTALDFNAAERARQEAAPTGYSTWEANRQVEDAARSAEQLRQLNERGQQMGIVEDFGNNDPMSRMPNMRVDENGIPIRADLSMEAQNLQNPLQRNLWGDELPVRTGDNGIPLTQALDRMPPGPARDAAVSQLSGQPVNPAALTDAVNATLRLRKNQGAIHPQVFEDLYKFGKSVIRGADGLLMPVYHGTIKEIKGEFKTAKGFRGYYDSTGGVDKNGWITAPERAYPGDLGAWFSSTPKGTDTFAGARTGTSGGNVHQVYLNLENPKVFRTHGEFIDWFKSVTDRGQSASYARRQLIKQGYDGIQIKESMTDGGGLRQDFVAFKPEQAKSAISPEGRSSIRKTNRFGQQGKVGSDLLTLGIPKLLDKMFSKEKEPINAYLSKLPGLSDKADAYISRPASSADLLEVAKAEKDGPSLWTNLQSGLTLAAKKTESTMLKNMAQWFDWSQNRANYLVREAVVPLESRLAHLRKDLPSVHATFLEEMFSGVEHSPEQLAAKGLSPKAIDAYQAVRSAYDMFYNEQNRARELLGKKPITRQEAYMASVFRGDYHIPVYDKSGKIRWYIQTQSKRQANAAINWLKKEYADHPEIDVSNLKYDHEKMFAPGRKFGAAPRDVMAAWKDIAEAMGDDPIAAEIKQAMEQWVADKGEHAFRQDLHHVREKVNVRGFEGDQPWLSPDKNAHNWAKAQIEYLKDAARWSATQEAIANTKTFLTDPTILQNQPNNVSLAKAYIYNHMGLTENLAKRLEDGLAGQLGLSKGFVNDLGAMVRTGVYFKTLVASPGYIVATPLQAIWASMGHFDMAKQQGLVKVDYPAFIKNMFEAMADERAGAPLSAFNKEALKWADDNGVISNVVYEDNKSVGSNVLADGSQKLLDMSIGIPDRFARRTTFLPFANAFWESGKFATKAEAFRAAGEITDAITVSMRPQDRPLAVQKLGQLGAMAYQFHAPILNMYNNLSVFAHHGKRTGDWMPLTKSLLAMGAVGGVFSLPLVNELEKASQLVKDAVAAVAPSKYKYVKDFDPRLSVLQAMPDIGLGELLSYGGASVATGVDLRSRFSNEIINSEDPLGSILPSTSVYGDMLSSGAKALANPNKYTGIQALKDFAPGGLARGLIETNSDAFKSAVQPHADQGITSFRKPSDITEPGVYVNRTDKEILARRAGVTALTESVRREKDALNDRETARLAQARKGVFNSMFKAIVNKTGDENTVREAVLDYLALQGDPKDIEKQLEEKFNDLPFTKQEMKLLKAKRLDQIMSVVRRVQMDQ